MIPLTNHDSRLRSRREVMKSFFFGWTSGMLRFHCVTRSLNPFLLLKDLQLKSCFRIHVFFGKLSDLTAQLPSTNLEIIPCDTYIEL